MSEEHRVLKKDDDSEDVEAHSARFQQNVEPTEPGEDDENDVEAHGPRVSGPRVSNPRVS